uniref:Uncharacterized protein n=1 Tax=Anguilla anguilla TaxID=7936 RepID=A0A0E9UZA5_ANGAN
MASFFPNECTVGMCTALKFPPITYQHCSQARRNIRNKSVFIHTDMSRTTQIIPTEQLESEGLCLCSEFGSLLG